jgi:hypothetical protein
VDLPIAWSAQKQLLGFLRRVDNPIPNRQFADGDDSYLAAPNPPAATVSGSVSG